MSKPEEKKNVTRRDFLKTAGVGVAGLVVGGAIGYVAKPTAPSTTMTITEMMTETMTGTVAPPATTVAPTGATITLVCDSGHNYLPWFDSATVDDNAGPDYGQNQGPAIEKALGITIAGDQIDSGTEFSILMSDLTGPKKWELLTYFPTYNGDIMGGGWLIPIDDFIAKYNVDMSQYPPAYRYLYCGWGGKTYALPYDGDVHDLYYRKDIFSNSDYKSKFKTQYGYDLAPPTTYSQYLDIAKFFTGWDWGSGDATGVAGGTKYGTAETIYDLTWGVFMDRFASLGGVYFDENMNPLVPNAAAVQALTDLKSVVPYMPPGILGTSAVDVFDHMTKGLVAMELTWPDVGPRCGSGSFPVKGDQVGTVRLPGYIVNGTLSALAWTGNGRVMGISVNTPTDLQETVFQIIKWMSVDHAAQYVPTGLNGEDPFSTASTSQASLPDWEKSNPGWSDTGILDYLAGQASNFSHACPDLYLPGASQYTDTLSRNILSALKGNITPKQAIDETVTSWNSTTQSLGADKQKTLWAQLIVQYKLAGIWPTTTATTTT
jgi:multiple sugar transport system substrate-binding protein